MNRPRAIPESLRTHKWARRARIVNPRRPRPEREQLERDLPELYRRIEKHFPGATMPAVDPSRMGMTQLQSMLRQLTESSPQVANDNFIQQYRKYLHTVLDH